MKEWVIAVVAAVGGSLIVFVLCLDPQCTASRGDFKMKEWVIAVVAVVG